MNEIDILKKLGAASGKVEVPDVDLTKLRLPQPAAQDGIAEDRPLMWIAAFSSAAAAGVWFFAAQELSHLTDPFSGVFYAIRLSLS